MKKKLKKGISKKEGNPPTLFNSHCAREPLSLRKKTPEKLTVAELRSELKRRGISIRSNARKHVLIAKLTEVLEDQMEHTADLVIPSAGYVSVAEATTYHGYHRNLLKNQKKRKFKVEKTLSSVSTASRVTAISPPKGRRPKAKARSRLVRKRKAYSNSDSWQDEKLQKKGRLRTSARLLLKSTSKK